MLIKIYGIGYEIIAGKLTNDQYIFWSEQSYDDLLNHMYYEEDIIEVPEECHIGHIFSKSDIAHIYGASMRQSEFIVESDDGEELLRSTTLTGIENSPVIKSERLSYTPEAGHHFVAVLVDSGDIYEIDTNSDEFHVERLNISVSSFNDIPLLISLESYEGIEFSLGDVSSRVESITLY
jgi:hypothetical protein